MVVIIIYGKDNSNYRCHYACNEEADKRTEEERWCRRFRF